MDEIQLAEMADSIEQDWQEETDTFQLRYVGGITEREGELLTAELERRGVAAAVYPMTDEYVRPVMRLFGLDPQERD